MFHLNNSGKTSIAIFIMDKVFEFITPTNQEEVAQFYRNLEHYLHPTRTGDWGQLKTVCIMGDSFTAEDKVKSEVGHVPRQHLPMLPHGTKSPMLVEGEVYRTVKVENLSMGGATMKKMLGKKETMERWVSDIPALTVVHLGPCDIGNKDIYKSSDSKPTKQYREKLYYFLDT